jgi:hypothetical protein
LNDQDAKQNTRVELKLQAKPQGQTLDLAIRISQQGLRKQKPHTVVQWFVCLIVSSPSEAQRWLTATAHPSAGLLADHEPRSTMPCQLETPPLIGKTDPAKI